VISTRTVYLESLGCSKNLVDSEATLGFLLQDGFRSIDDPFQAELLVLNTCGFIEDAKRQSVERILELAELKKSTGAKLVVFGCLSQRYADELSKEIPEVDLLAGVGQQERLTEAIRNLYQEDDSSLISLHPDAPRISFAGFLDRPLMTPPHLAYVKLGEGCSHKCAFCAIPSIRGKFKSREPGDILREVETLSARGVREINLISQDSAYYGKDAGAQDALYDLLKRLSTVSDLRWIRLFYFHPALVNPDMLLRMFDLPRVLPYLDMPIQHASDKMLKIMRRGHKRDYMAKLLTDMRRARPDLSLRSTVLVGHPGETEEDLGELLDFIEEHPFDKLGVFGYSLEENTEGAELPDAVEAEEITERVDRVQLAQMPISEERAAGLVGQRFTGVVEELAEQGEGLPEERRLRTLESSPFEAARAAIRTWRDAYEVDGYLYLDDDSDLELGDWVDVEVTDSDVYDLKGKILGPASP
jgi:ribosomal protein S12 methylthiotransferase